MLKRVSVFQEAEALQAELALVFQNLNVTEPLLIKSLSTSGPSGVARMFSSTSGRFNHNVRHNLTLHYQIRTPAIYLSRGKFAKYLDKQLKLVNIRHTWDMSILII